MGRPPRNIDFRSHPDHLANPKMDKGSATILLAILALGAQASLPIPARAADSKSKETAEVQVSKGASNEAYDRGVDEVALASQENAIAKLNALLKKYKGSRQEPILLSRLGDIQQQCASILFRISHASSAHGAKGKNDQGRYKKAVQQTISTFSTLIAKYPNYEEVPHAYFARGKSHEDIGEKDKATRDYLHLIRNFPITEESLSAYMALAEFSIEANDHPRAIGFLKEVEKFENSPHYPFALYKLAWSHYNLKNIPAALGYAERQIGFYNARAKAEGTDVTSDNALKENTLLDLAVFYFEGYEQKSPAYSREKALPYFKGIENGPVLGKIMLRFAKLLRSHSHEADLLAFKNEVIQKESERPESLEVVITTYDFQLNKRDYPRVIESAQDMARLWQSGKRYDGFGRAQKQVLDTAEGLQTAILKNKEATEIRRYSEILATVYDTFTRMVEETDPRIPRVHYNLAETLFAIKDYAGATVHYRWVVTHPQVALKDATVADSALKAIACRYEVLRDKNLIPRELTARSPKSVKPATLDAMLGEWIEWIDTEFAAYFKGESYKDKKELGKTTENFLFESARSLYAQGHITRAMERMRELIKRNPKSTYAVPSASLILDTGIASEDWELVHELATDFLKVKEWTSHDPEFMKRLFAVAADAYYKQIEARYQANDPKGVVKMAEKFLDMYSASKRQTDTLTLAGAAALSINEKARAQKYFSQIIDASKDLSSDKLGTHAGDNLAAALGSRAQMHEDRYFFTMAAKDYQALLALPKDKLSEKIRLTGEKADALRRKVLALIWLSDDWKELRATLANPGVCTEALAGDCERYSALVILNSPDKLQDEAVIEKAFDKSRKNATGTKDIRALWAAIALEGSKQLAFRDRNNALRTLANGWDELDPLVKFTLLPRINVSIPRAFELNRAAMKEVAPLRADERYITRRVEVIREMENAATKIVQMPWARIRASVMSELASLYIDLARGLESLPPPKGLNEAETAAYQDTIRKLTLPFEEKGQDVRAKAFEIASRASVEDEVLMKIAEPFFAENPSQAKKIKLATPVAESTLFAVTSLEQLDPNGEWSFIRKNKIPDAEDRVMQLKHVWAIAVKNRKWQQVGFLMQEAQEKALIPAGPMSIVKALSLASAGARAEAVAEIESGRKDLVADGQTYARIQLLQLALRSMSREHAALILKELKDLQAASKSGPSRDLAPLQAIADGYTK